MLKDIGVQHRMAATGDKAPLGLIMFTAFTLASLIPIAAL
jgi:hypothetical protein